MNNKINQQFDEIKNILKDVNYELAFEYILWTKDKAKIKFNKKLPNFPIINNHIYWCNLGINIGSEQNKIRHSFPTRRSSDLKILILLY